LMTGKVNEVSALDSNNISPEIGEKRDAQKK